MKKASKPGDKLMAFRAKAEGESKKKEKSEMKKPKTYKGKSLKLGGGGQFAKLKDKLAKKGVRNPAAVAAKVGRTKYGAKKMSKMAAAGRKRAAKK